MATQRRERKVVTVLFCDLVGFTSRAEALDPEDVEAILRPYHARVRDELQRYGGTVEKFIGDAVMALFGAPAAHEDDPERAVRAGIAIREFATEDGLELRIGITTGEALVSLDASPAEGEGMASGDVVNTAARLQSAAPVNGVIADETTYRATRHAVHYRESAPVKAKGKSEPVAVWEAIEARARLGSEVLDHAAVDLVGRDRELAVLRAAFDRVREESSSQLITLVGVPGIGKSRLLYELSRVVDAEPELTTWRQGRCLAYGDGITFWALAEIVKAQAGIQEADDDATAVEKLRRAAEEIVDPADADWVAARLRPLAGIEDLSELGADRGVEAFAAWRRFFEELAAQRPLVLVFEDLQWADEGLLSFVDELVDWVTGVPMLVVCTARPELLARRANWGGGKLNASTIAIEPLSDDETARLMGTLLERVVLPADVQQTLLERAGGNPLYAEQFAQLYVERGSAEDLPLPETLQGIISARLDDLPLEEKALLHAGSVVGKVFWTGALNGDGEHVEPIVHALVRKGFLRRQRRSSVAGEVELAFAHALVRDVAYGQLPRAERAAKHRVVAEWLESLGRPEDHAEMLAYHWRSALELAGASGDDTEELEERTRLALREAGDRAFALNSFPAAGEYYEDALELWPPADPERPTLFFTLARALMVAADERRVDALERAGEALLAAGDRERAAETEASLAQIAWYQGRQDDVFAHLEIAEARVEGARPSPAAARVLAISARYRQLAGRLEEGRLLATEALAMATDLGLDELRAHALTTIGGATFFLGDPAGEQELQVALDIALATNSLMAGTVLNNLSVMASITDTRRSMALLVESRDFSHRMGDRETMRFTEGNLVHDEWATGRWDEALTSAGTFIAACESGSPHVLEYFVRDVRGMLLFARGQTEAACEDFRRARKLESERSEPGHLESYGVTACASMLLGRADEARAFAQEFAVSLRRGTHLFQSRHAWIALFAEELGIAPILREFADASLPGLLRDAALAALDGDLLRAADVFDAAGFLPGAAHARTRAAQTLIAEGRVDEGLAELDQALAFYRSVNATFFLERGEALLAQAATG